MAVHFRTATPKKLLSSYKQAVDEGREKNWKYDKDGDFSYLGTCSGRAWLRPKIFENEKLTFYILTPIEQELATSTYAIYHSRMVESLLTYCDSLFETASVSSMGEENDVLRST